jgi:hypothetical protein
MVVNKSCTLLCIGNAADPAVLDVRFELLTLDVNGISDRSDRDNDVLLEDVRWCCRAAFSSVSTLADARVRACTGWAVAAAGSIK